MNKQRILEELSKLLDDDQVVNAETLAKIDGILWILYPGGVKPAQYADLVRTMRVLERLCQLQEMSAQAASPQEAVSNASAVPEPPSSAPQHVDDDSTAPITTDQLFADFMRTQQAAWTALTASAQRDRDAEREASASENPAAGFKHQADAKDSADDAVPTPSDD